MSFSSPNNLVTALAMMQAWIGLCGAMRMSRKPSSQTKNSLARRNNNSLYGVALQASALAGPCPHAPSDLCGAVRTDVRKRSSHGRQVNRIAGIPLIVAGTLMGVQIEEKLLHPAFGDYTRRAKRLIPLLR